MAVNLSPYGGVGAQFLDNSGNVLTGGKIFTYSAGTTTPQPTYTTSVGSIPHPNPIILDAAGRVPSGGEIWLTDGLSYKFILRDANDVLIATYDNISGINSNFVAFTNQQEIQTATAGQTVFNLTTMSYQPGTNSLSVFVDGVNQYGPGAQYAYVETDSDTVTFVNGLHVGAEVKFTTSQLNSSGLQADAFQVSYTPPFNGSVATNVGDVLAQTVSVKDFGAVGNGITNDTAAFASALAASDSIYVPEGTYLVDTVKFLQRGGINLIGQSKTTTILKASASSTKLIDISGTISAYIIENTVENMTLDMSNMTDATTSYGIYMARSYNNNFNNVNVIGFGTSKRSISLQCLPGVLSGGGVFTTQFTNCDFGSIAGTIELKGNSTADAITTITFLDTRFAQARIDGAVSINFIQATVQGPLDKFVLANTFGVSISGSDIEGTGVYLVLGAANQHFYSYANQFVGFSGTYLTGTVGDRSYINDPFLQNVQFIGHSVTLTDGKFQAVSGLGIGLRHLSEVTGTPTQNDWEFKTTNGSVYVGQEATGTASIDNRAGGDILLRDNGTIRFGYLKSSNRLTVGSATAVSAGAVAGYIEVVIGGNVYKIPYHNV